MVTMHLPPLTFALIVIYVVAVTFLFGVFFVEQLGQRRKARRPVVPTAPADDELPPVDDADLRVLLREIYRAQTRARLKGIYGEDGQP